MGVIHDWLLNKERITDNGGGGGTPAGSNGQIQFNASGAFGADSNLVWDNLNKKLIIGQSDSFNAEISTAFFLKNTGGNTTFSAQNFSNNTANRNSFTFNRFGGTESIPAAVADNMQIFTINNNAYDGTANITVSQIRAFIDTYTGTNDVSGKLCFATRDNGIGAPLIDAFFINKNASITMPEVYNTTVGSTNRDAYVDDTGLLGYISSALKYKENLRDLTPEQIEDIFKIPVKLFDFKDTSKGIDQLGTIAEEVEKYFPQLCSYKYEYVSEIEEDENGINRLIKIPVLDEFGNHLKELETVQYSKIGLLALLAVQNLDERLKVLEA